MGKTMNCKNLRDALTVALTSAEQHLESKAVLREALLATIESRCAIAESWSKPEDVPVSLLELLHSTFGLCFEAHGGKMAVRLPM